MFRKVLIANRGEIAVRIIRACKELNISTVAIYSSADEESLHVQLADEAVCVGEPQSNLSYLNTKNIISVATKLNCDAIHPGFGFLSENSKFSELCKSVGIAFIGPSKEVIDNMGNKSKAREIMIKNKVPVVPGTNTKLSDMEEGLKMAKKIGYPILIKASAGGGGKGMRIANTEKEFENAFNTAQLEAKTSFGSDEMYLERLLVNIKHIEVQILADKFGNVVHLGERDCSLQRNNQKVLEEAPAASIKKELRDKMGAVAVKAAKAVKYENAGTIEFLVSNDEFFFIEMNTRVQVEHPITEMVTGIDIIKEQLRIASGKKLSFKQSDVKIKGHSIECRINAEDPQNGFRPSPGTIDLLHIPNGFNVRFDSQLYQGYTIPRYYDSMIGKLIVYGDNRKEAIRKMRSALEELVIEGKGVKTNLPFQYLLLHNSKFVRGKFDTSFIEKNIKYLTNYEER